MQTIEKQKNINAAVGQIITIEDELRARIYKLLAKFLSGSPDKSSLELAVALKGDDGEFGDAINRFSNIAAHKTIENVEDEFQNLFIGVTRGELLPYGSYYQAGFLNEKPLANLRADMSKLGVERVSNLKEPEDHIASVLEIMAGLIEGSYGDPLSLDEQKQFFHSHVNSWASHFFADLEGAEFSVFYAPLGTIGRLFMKIEQDAFEMC